MKKNDVLSLLNYIFIAFILLWSPVQMFILKFDNIGRIPALISLLFFMFNFFFDSRFLSFFKNRSICFLSILVFYTLINSFLCEYNVKLFKLPYFLFTLKYIVSPLIVCLVSFREYGRNCRGFVKYVCVIYFVYLVLGLCNGFTFNISERNSNALQNAYPIALVFYVFVLFTSMLINQRRNSIVLVFFVLAIIAISSVRKAFLGSFIIMLFFYISKLKGLSAKNIIKLLFLLSIASILLILTLEYTFLGERFVVGLETGEQENSTGIQFLSILGDRVFMYVEGFEMFKDNTIHGIGLGNYQLFSPAGMMMHSEFMAQLVENGIIGFILLFAFYLSLICKLIKLHRVNDVILKRLSFLSLGTILCIMFINITAWTYDNYYVFLSYGIIAAISQTDENTVRL